MIISTNGTNFPNVATVWIYPPNEEPIIFNNAVNTIIPKAIGNTNFILYEVEPNNSEACCANITPVAAIVPGKNKTVCIHPVKNP